MDHPPAIIFNALAIVLSLPLTLYRAAGTSLATLEGRWSKIAKIVILAFTGFLAPVLAIPLIERTLTGLHLG